MSDEWTPERIAELRQRAEEVVAAVEARDAYRLSKAVDRLDERLAADDVLSLLDALEEARSETQVVTAQRDSLQAHL